jgi:hypothetical protein
VGELKAPGKSFDISKWAVWEAWEKVKANKGAPGGLFTRVQPNLSTRILMNISESHAGVSICARGRVTLEVQQLLPFCFVVGQTSK